MAAASVEICRSGDIVADFDGAVSVVPSRPNDRPLMGPNAMCTPSFASEGILDSVFTTQTGVNNDQGINNTILEIS